MVFTSGVFITTIPLLVAAANSILSIPTPARPITFKDFAICSILLSTFVPLRMIIPSTSSTALSFSSNEESAFIMRSKPESLKIERPCFEIGSAIRTFMKYFLFVIETNQIER